MEKKLKKAGNYVEVHRIPDSFHGFFALGIKNFHVQESFDLINQFLQNGGIGCNKKEPTGEN